MRRRIPGSQAGFRIPAFHWPVIRTAKDKYQQGAKHQRKYFLFKYDHSKPILTP
jgi:hypothetical protein